MDKDNCYLTNQWAESKEALITNSESVSNEITSQGLISRCIKKEDWRSFYARLFKDKVVYLTSDYIDPIGYDLEEYALVKVIDLKKVAHRLAEKEASENCLANFLSEEAVLLDNWENSNPLFKRLSTVKAKKADWLWKDRIPRNCVTLVEGDGGIGKSFVIADTIARLTSGRALPGNSESPPVNVILLALEDDPEVVLRPRFEAQGANCDRVYFLDQTFQLNQKNLEILENQVIKRKAELIVIDPIVAYFSNGDTNKSTDVRAFINGLHTIAKKHHIAIVGVRHWNKNTLAKAAQRGSGSVDFRNASRSVLQVIKTEDARYLALEKSNYAAQAKTLSFSIQNGVLSWGEESDLTADEILKMSINDNQVEKSALEEAKDFIKETLEEGPIKAKDLKRLAEELGIAPITLRRAKNELDIKTKRIHGVYHSILPKMTEHDQSDHRFKVTNNDQADHPVPLSLETPDNYYQGTI